MAKYLIPLICLSLLFFSSPAIAGKKTFIREYTYQANEYDSKVSCRTLALEQVTRQLREELGTYLESYTEVENFQLLKDKIKTLTAGIVRAEVIDEKFDGKKYWLQAKMEADPDEVLKAVDSLRKDREESKKVEGYRKGFPPLSRTAPTTIWFKSDR